MASINDFAEARRAFFDHADHALEIVGYGPKFGLEMNVAIQCIDCGMVIADWDNPEVATPDNGWGVVAEATQTAKAIAWDGCHKIYVCMDDQQVAKQREYGYGEGGTYLFDSQHFSPEEMLALLHDWYEGSCGLRFISAVHTVEGDPNKGYVDLIPQGWEEEE
jgi:hypothetical protein